MGTRKLAGEISDAIPNEFSKLNSYSKYLQYIPYVGAALKVISNAVSGVDRFGETYSNGGSFMDSAQYGMSAFQDTAGDPNKYSPKNRSFADADGWLKAGKIGEALPGSKSDYGSAGRTMGLVKDITSSNKQVETSPYQSTLRKSPAGYTINQPSITFGNGAGGGDINQMISQAMGGLKAYTSR